MSEKRVVRTEVAPAPFQGAPYSQAIAAGGFVFVSGQLGLKPGDTAISGEIAEQTGQVFANLKAILEEAGTGLERLVKTTVFLQHLEDFQAMNEVYARHVGEQPPARATVEVAKLPSGALVEIEAIALLELARPSVSLAGKSNFGPGERGLPALRAVWHSLSGDGLRGPLARAAGVHAKRAGPRDENERSSHRSPTRAQHEATGNRISRRRSSFTPAGNA